MIKEACCETFGANLLSLNVKFFQKANLKYTVLVISIENTSRGSTIVPRNRNL